MEFLNMHYVADNDVKDNQHDNLPFKSHCTMANHIIVAEVHFFPEQNYFNLSFFELGLVKYKEVFYSSRMAESIWQPPKLS